MNQNTESRTRPSEYKSTESKSGISYSRTSYSTPPPPTLSLPSNPPHPPPLPSLYSADKHHESAYRDKQLMCNIGKQVGNEFSQVEGLWSQFENVMAQQPQQGQPQQSQQSQSQSQTETTHEQERGD